MAWFQQVALAVELVLLEFRTDQKAQPADAPFLFHGHGGRDRRHQDMGLRRDEGSGYAPQDWGEPRGRLSSLTLPMTGELKNEPHFPIGKVAGTVRL